ncbi:NAD(P)-dependent alcohol dehydrogenase [Amycolatopsis ultiminotia]|uniref:NAD(P)-dependent alcohol dehydrogenase n=1 Tax=Amycolatopsis ultiminotia TaxID=543629 RepID=A0ABP6W107_9PSEU
MATMRAALYDSYGGPDVLYEGTLPIPEVGDDDVLVRVAATTVNGGELLMRSGRLKLITGSKFPLPLGIDFVGTATKIGSKVSNVAVGDPVWGMVEERRGLGANAEYAIATSNHLASAPTNLTPVEAAGLLVGGTTALTGLRDKTNLQSGERLLVRGAAGGVGTMAVQLGKHLGAHVTALAKEEQIEALRDLGADDVLDYRTTKPDQVGKYDVIFDTKGTQLPAFRRQLRPGGRMVAIAFDITRLVSSLGYIGLSSIHGSGRVRFFRGKPTRPLFEQLTRLAETSALRPVVDSTYRLDQISSAHAALEAGGMFGKAVIDLS